MVDEPLDIVYELRERRYITAKLRRWQRNLQNILEENSSDVSYGDSLRSQSVVVSPSSCRLRQSSVETASTSTSMSRDTSRYKRKSCDNKHSRSSLSSQSVVVSRQRKHSSLYSSYSTLSAGTHRKFSHEKGGSSSPKISNLNGGRTTTSSFIPSISSCSPSTLPVDLDLPNCEYSQSINLSESNSSDRRTSSQTPRVDNRNRNSKSDEIETPGGGKEKLLEIDRELTRDRDRKSRDHEDLHDDVTDPICISINYFTPKTTSAVGNELMKLLRV